MITKAQLLRMLELQDSLNCQVNANWLHARYPWHRAIMAEAVEAMDHYGWKWWKQQVPNLKQVQLEVVDIWHFIMSMAIENAHGDHEEAAGMILRLFYQPETTISKDTLALFDLLAGYAAEGKICVPAFIHLMKEVELTWEQMYNMYIIKNVLNRFRQDNGYRIGTYQKVWSGLEDNEWAVKIVDETPDITPEALYLQLAKHYALEMQYNSNPAADAA